MKYFVLLIIALTIIIGCKEKNEPTTQESKISIGTIDSVYSKILNEQRKIWVHVPGSLANSFAGETTYPVLYLLDGDAHFYSVVGMLHQLSTINGNTLCPEMIVVGIPNTDRTRDLTPTNVKSAFGDTTFVKTSGGAENFTRFMEEELIPYIDREYPTTSHRTLVGHSFGGLFVVNTLLKHSNLFSNYVAIDPSLWWDERKLSKESKAILTEKKFENKSLYVAIANTMRKGMQLSDLPQDTTQATEHIRSIVEFAESTAATKTNGLTFNSRYYAEDDHGSVPLIAEHDALRALYSWYKLDGINEFFDPNSKATTEELIGLITSHYKNASERLGYALLPPEGMINSLGYGFMGNTMNDKAYALFNLNIQNYPKSSNVYDSMGDYYVAQKDTVHAIESFSKALTFGEAPHTKEKLKMMKGEK